MSWRYLLGLEEVSSEAICWDGERFAPSSGQTTLGGYCLPDSETESCHDSRSGMMSRHLTANLGKAALMLSAEDSLAKTFPVLERARESLAKDQGCGRTWRGSSVKLSQNGSWLKIAHSLLPEDSIPFCGTWPRWGTMRNGECLERLTLERPTSATGSGLLPTPLASLGTNGGPNQRDSSGRPGLQMAAMTWATPQSRDFRTGQQSRWDNPQRTRNLNDQVGGQLNPTWVEWLMAWPVGWTDLKPLGTDKSRLWLH